MHCAEGSHRYVVRPGRVHPGKLFDLRLRGGSALHRTPERLRPNPAPSFMDCIRLELPKANRAGNIKTNPQLLRQLARQGLQRKLVRIGFPAGLDENGGRALANEQDFAPLVLDHRSDGEDWLRAFHSHSPAACGMSKKLTMRTNRPAGSTSPKSIPLNRSIPSAMTIDHV